LVFRSFGPTPTGAVYISFWSGYDNKYINFFISIKKGVCFYMEMIITTGTQSYIINENQLPIVEAGSVAFIPSQKRFYFVMPNGILLPIDEEEAASVVSLAALNSAIAAGGEVAVMGHIDAPTALVIAADTAITNNGEISISEDPNGDGVFTVTSGTLTLDGEGTINGVGKNDWNMALWAKDNGKVVIKNGYFTNAGATANVDPAHFDLIYASGNAQIEILGGEFKCETPAWTLNVKDKDRATASIVVKGGKFHGFDPSNCASEGPNTNFVAPGYKAVETDGVFEVMPE
jgi:hypothetical protein